MRKIRAFYPWPTAFTYLDNKLLKILKAKTVDNTLPQGKLLFENNSVFIGTGNKSLEILELQFEGKNKVSSKEFINGYNKYNGANL